MVIHSDYLAIIETTAANRGYAVNDRLLNECRKKLFSATSDEQVINAIKNGFEQYEKTLNL